MHGPVSVHTEHFTTTICGSQLVNVFSALNALSTFGCQYILAPVLFFYARVCACVDV